MRRCLDSVSNITARYCRSLSPTIYFYVFMLLQLRLSVRHKRCHTNMWKLLISHVTKCEKAEENSGSIMTKHLGGKMCVGKLPVNHFVDNFLIFCAMYYCRFFFFLLMYNAWCLSKMVDTIFVIKTYDVFICNRLCTMRQLKVRL